MARTNKGILGHFSGTVGTVVGSNWRGIEYMRSKSKRRSRNFTEGQLMVQAKFLLITRFIKALSQIVTYAFNDPSADKTGMNRAFSYNYRNAVIGVYPTLNIDFTKVLVSEGILIAAAGTALTDETNGVVKFAWTPNSGGNALDTDVSVGVIYCPELNRAIYTTSGAGRSVGEQTLDVSLFSGKLVHGYLFFSTNTDVSTSIYVGSLTVS
ncbi:MAG: hypothetical protein EOP54_31765 [Sphingobacteriales bacterium]|nr:MAG: hypothetical protein EOP54_31765 [Sphingobacteriales bacterium]